MKIKKTGLKKVEGIKIIYLIISIILSVGFPLGIVFTAVGFSSGYKAMGIIGIVLMVVGFYIMPCLWLLFAKYVTVYRIMYAILNEHVYTSKEIASMLNKNEKEVSDIIYMCISKRFLEGVKFEKGKIEFILREEQVLGSYKCNSCGAIMERNDEELFCPYCGNKKM